MENRRIGIRRQLEMLMGEEGGQGAVEYGVILVAVSIAAIVTVRAIGDNVKARAEHAAEKIMEAFGS